MSQHPQIENSTLKTAFIGGADIDFGNSEALYTIESMLAALDQILSQDDITDVMINSADHIYIEQRGKMMNAPFTIASNGLVVQLAERLATATGKKDVLDSNFALDGMLPNGCRITIIMPPASLDSPTISIRRFPKEVFRMSDMVEVGLLSPRMREFLKTAVERRANILISGNTSSGKTTLLNALSVHISPHDRLVTIEDTPELNIMQENVVRLEIDPSSHQDDHNARSARALLRNSLRIRPDRIVMGEIRGGEAFDFIQAINTGHKGSMATVHANTPRETLTRLEHMVRMGVDLPEQLIKQQISSSLDLVIQTYRNHEGVRRISHIAEVVGMEGDTMVTHDHFTYKHNEEGELGYQWARTNSRKACIQTAIEAAAKA